MIGNPSRVFARNLNKRKDARHFPSQSTSHFSVLGQIAQQVIYTYRVCSLNSPVPPPNQSRTFQSKRESSEVPRISLEDTPPGWNPLFCPKIADRIKPRCPCLVLLGNQKLITAHTEIIHKAGIMCSEYELRIVLIGGFVQEERDELVCKVGMKGKHRSRQPSAPRPVSKLVRHIPTKRIIA